jgi:hypothetical protein
VERSGENILKQAKLFSKPKLSCRVVYFHTKNPNFGIFWKQLWCTLEVLVTEKGWYIW